MKRTYIILLLILMAFCIFKAFALFTSEATILYINWHNRREFEEIIKNDNIDNIDYISKVTYGSGFHSGELNIYYLNGEIYNEWVTEGTVNYDQLIPYIKEHGIDSSNIAIILMGVFIVSFIIVIKINKGMHSKSI